MTTGPRPASTRRRALIVACCLAALAALLATIGQSSQAGAAVSGPDVTVFAFNSINSFGSANGFAAYSVGTTSCNRGDTPLNWCNSVVAVLPAPRRRTTRSSPRTCTGSRMAVSSRSA